MKTTRNYCLDVIRGRAREVVMAGSEEDYSIHHLESNDASPAQSFALKETREFIDRALNNLPDPLRSSFILYEINGLKYREIADVLGLPINSVKVNISRARIKLREWISSHSNNTNEVE